MASAINPGGKTDDPSAPADRPSAGTRPIVIGSRGSPLALAQADEVAQRLGEAFPALREAGGIAIEKISTKGDRHLGQPLASLGGKELFTKEIEDALLDGRIRLAQHCLKDLPTEQPPGLVVGAILPRESPWDAFFARDGHTLAELPDGARLGTSSLRRAAFLKAHRRDLRIVTLRGNVGTRLAKIESGEADATILAVAGLNRLGEGARIKEVLSAEILLPAPGQGSIALECREDDAEMRDMLAALSCPRAEAASEAERALLAALDGSCRTPIAALAEIDGTTLTLRAAIARPDGTEIIEDQGTCPVADAAAFGAEMGGTLRAQAGPGFFDP